MFKKTLLRTIKYFYNPKDHRIHLAELQALRAHESQPTYRDRKKAKFYI